MICVGIKDLIDINRRKKPLKEGYFRFSSVPLWFKHLVKGTMSVWTKARSLFLLLHLHRRCRPILFLQIFHVLSLSTSAVYSMMLTTTQKGAIMQGTYCVDLYNFSVMRFC